MSIGKQLIIVSIIISVSYLKAIDSSHFWRPHTLWSEPRIARDRLRTFNVSFAQGSAHESRDSTRRRVPLFAILTDKAVAPTQAQNSSLCSQGQFEFIDAYLEAYQTITNGFFVQLTIPIRAFSLTHLNSNPRGPCDLKPRRLSYAALGDTTALLGWSQQYDITETFDFFDFMLKAGMLFPTGREGRLQHGWFEIPTGYNGHFALAITGDITVGIFNWLTLGLHGEHLTFFVQKPLRVLGAFIKADHVAQGFSLALGYSYEQQGHSLCNRSRGFSQHALNIVAEYDFSSTASGLYPHLSFFYNKSLAGKRIFISSAYGSILGVDICWQF